MRASVVIRLLSLIGLIGFALSAPAGAQYGPLIVDLDRGPDEVIDLWNGPPPGGTPQDLAEHFVERDNAFGLPDRAIRDVTRPRLSVFKPENPDGSAILLIPGGGYRHVVVEKEGYEGARWFNRKGATVYVLFYRLPHQGWAGGPDAPLQDAQRAMRMIRAQAEENGIDPNRVMVMGFSAGGHLGGSLLTRFDKAAYEARDDLDQLSARPDAGVLVYPVITLTEPYTHGSTSENMVGQGAEISEKLAFSVEHEPPTDMPPVFLLHASDDTAVPVENSLMAYSSFKSAGALVSLHVFETGGHGFGMRGIDDAPVGVWPELVMAWGRDQEIFASHPREDIEE